MRTHRAQSGVALITVLVILFLAVALSSAMIWENGLDQRRTATLVQGDQAMEYALGAEAWAEQILRRDASQNAAVTNLSQNWAQQLPPLPVEGGQIIGHLEDMQGRFNLNSLSTAFNAQAPKSLAQFQALLTALNLDPLLAAAVSDWVNTGTNANPLGGAKDDYYSRLQPPYLTALGPMGSVTELLLVKGVTPEVYARLSPYVCALPAVQQGTGGQTPTTVNVNTAAEPVLQSLDPHMTADLAQQMVGLRGTQGFNSVQAAFQPTGIAAPATAAVNSDYFLLTVVAEIGTTHVTLYSLLYRNGGNVTAVRRTFGTL
jgi:general secretion pathway protein K